MSTGTNHQSELAELRRRTIQIRRDTNALVTAHLHGQPTRRIFAQMLNDVPAQERADYAVEVVHNLAAELAILLEDTLGPNAAKAMMQTAGEQFERNVGNIAVIPVNESGEPAPHDGA